MNRNRPCKTVLINNATVTAYEKAFEMDCDFGWYGR